MNSFRENYRGPVGEEMIDSEVRETTDAEAESIEADEEVFEERAGEGAESDAEDGDQRKEDADEKAIEEYRGKIEGSETQTEDAPEKEEAIEARKLTPDEMFSMYKEAVAKYVQEHERPLKEKIANGIMEVAPLREIRQGRADGILEDLTELLRKLQEGVVIRNAVDLGCGQGEIMRGIMDRLKEDNPDVKGICIDKETHVAEDRLGDDTVFVRGDAVDTGLAAGSVDFVNVDYLLQALDEEMQKSVLEEVKRLISEQGHAIIMDVIDRGGIDYITDKAKHKVMNAFAPYNIRTEEGWEKFLEDSGFEIEAKTYSGDRSVAFLVKVKQPITSEQA